MLSAVQLKNYKKDDKRGPNKGSLKPYNRVLEGWQNCVGHSVSLHHSGSLHKKPIGLFYWLTAENKLCDQQTFMILPRFDQCNLHKWTQILWI